MGGKLKIPVPTTIPTNTAMDFINENDFGVCTSFKLILLI